MTPCDCLDGSPGRRWDRERARELESYLEIETADNVARGLSPADARDAARRRLGNLTRIREEIHDMNTIGWFDRLASDVRFALRLLRTNAGFTVVAIASLALGIGANTAIFQLLDAVRLRSLPVQRPHGWSRCGSPAATAAWASRAATVS